MLVGGRREGRGFGATGDVREKGRGERWLMGEVSSRKREAEERREKERRKRERRDSPRELELQLRRDVCEDWES